MERPDLNVGGGAPAVRAVPPVTTVSRSVDRPVVPGGAAGPERRRWRPLLSALLDTRLLQRGEETLGQIVAQEMLQLW